jgi:hypothetical protein
MKKIIYSIAYCIVLVTSLCAQPVKIPYLGDKPGTFEILARTNYSMYQKFTPAEMAANMERIKELVAIVRQDPVLADIKGFMGRARIYDISNTQKCNYGVPARISFEFSDYLYSKGKITYNAIEPPEWSILLNHMSGYWNGFNTEKCMFTIPANKRTIAPGVDVYDDVTYVIYDPSRPPYWVPVTVEEAFAVAREEAKKEKDEISAKYLNEFLEKEWAAISPANLKNQAYYGGGISRVSDAPGMGGQNNLFPPIVKVNPEYWNKSLPKSAIQFMVLTVSMDKKYLQSEFESCVKHKYYGETCNLSRFLVSYDEEDIKKLTQLIGK